MAEYIFLTHNDAPGDGNWAPYLKKLQDVGVFRGGSAIGAGECVRKAGESAPLSAHIVGFIRVAALDIENAKLLLAGHPTYEAGGTVEIRELPRTD